MTYFILGVTLLAGLLLAGRWFVTAEPHTIKRALGWTLVTLILGVIAFFALSGRLAWALAALPALVPWIIRLRVAVRLARMFAAFRRSAGGQAGAGPAGGGAMPVAEAWAVLGLEPGAGRDAVIAAHRRLIANLHPDRGGSDYLAARINQAKDILLKLPENQ